MTDGIEKFEVTDWDLENEFNPNRVRHNLTKKQQIYGVFASDSDDDERPSFSKKKSSGGVSQINFISGGVRTVGEKPENKESDEEDAKGSSEDEAPVKAAPKKSYSNQRSGFSGTRNAHQIAGLRSLQKNSSGNDQFGGWEKYTKGIGQKLLLQMGYKPGKGLGKTLQGITTPIEAKLRKGKGAIGLYGPEQPTMKRAGGPETIEEETEETDETKKHKRQWKKKDGDIKPKVEYYLQSADEARQEGAASGRYRGDATAISSVKVIDMTGPEQRIFSGYHQIHQQQHSKPREQDVEETEARVKKGEHFSLPELEHNLKLLRDEEKQKIIRCERQKQYSENQIINIGHEKIRLEQVLKQENKQLETLEKVFKIVESMDNKTNEDSNETLEIAARTFKDLQDDYYEEYKMYNLSDLAITIVVPLVQKLMKDWDPFDQKHHCIDIFQDWRALLESSNPVSGHGGMGQELQPYHRLVWDVWMPPVRKAILNWNVRNWSPLIELLDTWHPLLLQWILDNILEQLVLPRLQKEVEAWNPLTDTLPVHSWLHPWLPLMGARLEPLYAPIRQKLSSALVNWHPSDCSAKLILEPWRAVFTQGVMDAFVINNIVPKLAMVLQAYVINPHQQHLDVWNWVTAWTDMMPEACMVTLLEKNFFPKWLQVLVTWLTHNPNYEEVTKWYTGWKSMLSPSLLAHPNIKEQFTRALDIMNRAVSAPQGLLGQQPGAKESMAYLTNVERQQEMERHVKPRREYEAMMQTIRGSASTTASLTSSFKDLIEKKAQESNIVFMPIAGKYQEGKQVYRFGSSMLYIDRGVIFVFNQKTWVPTSLQSLLDTAG